MIYLDTSCLVKLIRQEAQSQAVSEALSREAQVIVSALTELETLVQFKAGYLAGDYGLAQRRRYETQLHLVQTAEPFHLKKIPAGTWETALRQHRNSQDIHCRTSDRIHLAIMEKL